MQNAKYGILVFCLVLLSFPVFSQATAVKPKLLAGNSRQLRYHPEGQDFVIVNGTHRFNRALYGSNTAFRAEAGDKPEFALYMPGMGGNLKFGFSKGNFSRWLIDSENIEARYHAGTMIYVIRDPVFVKGSIRIRVLALPDADGMIVQLDAHEIPAGIDLFWAYGGATGKKFSRDGDLGADPESSFDLKSAYCADNEYLIRDNKFTLYYGSGRSLSENERYENNYKPTTDELEATRLKTKKRILGLVPPGSAMHVTDASKLENPLVFYSSGKEEAPAVAGKLRLQKNSPYYFFLVDPDTKGNADYSELPVIFRKADSARQVIADQIKINTPDGYINAVGASLSIASDAVWDGNSYMHGAIAWRMPLNGWRGAYTADWLGWHDRARTHLNGYFKAQYTEPASGPNVPDTLTHLARQKEETGTALFTTGYISRSPGKINKPHHYDMNLVFIDQLLWHYRWTGDLDFVRTSWPVLERHLAWEKRNFDADDDGLYDAYCCIWASDALQYSGGGVTHSSAYNYQANKTAAELAVLIGENPEPYLKEAEKIRSAVNKQLWLPNQGWFAEYKDLLGNKLVHPSAALWTVYHSIDEGLADNFQAYQATQYMDHSIPHIPVEAAGLPPGKYCTLSTTNWMPYTWSINNVASSEVLHASLAYWQAGRSEEAFKLAKSNFLDFMFLGSSPANFGQLSYYDAYRGELYRDFADPIGMASRVLVEGLFGITPDLLHDRLTIKPGWPEKWDHASIETPDIKLNFSRIGSTDRYQVESRFPKTLHLKLMLRGLKDEIKSVRLNNKEVNWSLTEDAVGFPEIEINSEAGFNFAIAIEWSGRKLEQILPKPFYGEGESVKFILKNSEIVKVYDPQQVFNSVETGRISFQAIVQGEKGWRSAFIKVKQGKMTWWEPISFELRKPVGLIVSPRQSADGLGFSVQNNTEDKAIVTVEAGGFKKESTIAGRSASGIISVPALNLVPGSNVISVKWGHTNSGEKLINWQIASKPGSNYETIDLSEKVNDRITHIFREQYFSPRSPYPTLSIPVQGIGDWCSFREQAEIDDSGIRAVAGKDNILRMPQGIPFALPAGKEGSNVLFTSMWDNYPHRAEIGLSGKASHAYLLMAGSGHHMESRLTNGIVTVVYADGSKEQLPLVSPDNWWTIEQDFYEDGLAFRIDVPRPPRLYLKTGEWHLDSYPVKSKNRSTRIEGGAASVLDLPLDPAKELRSLTLETIANDVVIGLMSLTLERD